MNEIYKPVFSEKPSTGNPQTFGERANELYRIVIQQSRTLVIEYDYLQNKTYVDPLLSQFVAGDFSTLAPGNLDCLKGIVYRPDLPELHALLHSADSMGALQRTKDIRFYTVEHSYEWFRVVVSVIVGGDGEKQRAIVTLNNINEELLARKKLEFLAEQDSLTRIANKDTFIEHVRMILDREPDQAHVVVRMDIERFHVLNQLFGAAEGDRVLKFLAVKLQELFELEEGVAYCRMASDVFAICMRYDDVQVNKALDEIQAAFKYYPLECEFTLCFGMYVIDDPSLPVETMLDRAAHAQKTIKGSYVCHKACYDEKLRTQELLESDILNDMGYALKHGQFEVYYQPKVRMDIRQVIGAEALVRWNHPQKGMITPGAFIPLFEKNGFVMQVDSFVWESVCERIRIWLDAGISVKPISVNVSRADLYNPRLVDVIVQIADKYRIPHRLLELELTESSFISDMMRLTSVTAELRQLGFTILMDDFGSGYSSLNALNDIDVDVLKLDMRFLSKSVETQKGSSILRDIITMANNIGITVLAEGVETEEHSQRLLSLGCRYGQGYLFGKPVPMQVYKSEFIGLPGTMPAHPNGRLFR